MSYTVIIERSARKQLDKIPPPFFEAIDKKILALETNPRPHVCKKLKDRDGWRIRVADYRIIYKIKDNILELLSLTWIIGNKFTDKIFFKRPSAFQSYFQKRINPFHHGQRPLSDKKTSKHQKRNLYLLQPA